MQRSSYLADKTYKSRSPYAKDHRVLKESVRKTDSFGIARLRETYTKQKKERIIKEMSKLQKTEKRQLSEKRSKSKPTKSDMPYKQNEKYNKPKRADFPSKSPASAKKNPLENAIRRNMQNKRHVSASPEYKNSFMTTSKNPLGAEKPAKYRKAAVSKYNTRQVSDILGETYSFGSEGVSPKIIIHTKVTTEDTQNDVLKLEDQRKVVKQVEGKLSNDFEHKTALKAAEKTVPLGGLLSRNDEENNDE